MRAVVTGGAGFLGSHLCSRLLEEGFEVVCIDNFITGSPRNVERLMGRPGFVLVRYNVTDYLHVPGDVSHIFHFASPASPRDYLELGIQTLKVGALGTHKALGMAKAKEARFVLASTSEVYGDPQVHPQVEDYWGHVNPIGPRGVYDEGKRFAEALAMAYHRTHSLDVKLARIFNCFGPWMRAHDGRAVPEFLTAALQGRPLVVHGDGSQTRSLCYVDDLIDGIMRLASSGHVGPMNLGRPDELSVLELAKLVVDVTGSTSPIEFGPRPTDDPGVRCPDISLARSVLGWEPSVTLEDGLRRTAEWFQKEIAR